MNEEKKGDSNIKENTGDSKLNESDFIHIPEQPVIDPSSKQAEMLELPKNENH